MKTGEAAKTFGVTHKTITTWTDQPDLAPFFSTGARASDIESQQRDYNIDDLYVLNTIRTNKTRQKSWKDIAELLDNGFRDKELPVAANLLKTISPIDAATNYLEIKARYDTALAQLHDATNEIERLRNELDREREHSEQILMDEHKRTADLYKTIGRLEEKVETLQTELQKQKKKP